MAISVEEKFKETIIKVFGKKIWDEEKFKGLYDNVIKKRDEILNNGKAEDGCGEFGDNPTTIELMLYVRKLMREEKLIPDVPLEICIQSKSLPINKLKKFVMFDFKTIGWLTEEYEKRFPESYKSEPESHMREYLDDGWDYSEYLKKNPSKADIEWFFKFNKKISHLYYNELDHYLTYLVGAILVGAKSRYKTKKNNTPDGIRQGKNIKEDLKRMPEKDL
jgi:hypothetical protein